MQAAAEHVGDLPFVVMLGDDIMHPKAGVLSGMLATFERFGHSVIALKEVPSQDISAYGCAAVKPLEDNVVEIEDLVEKPAPGEAPSNLAVMGRYVFSPEILDVLARTPSVGGAKSSSPTPSETLTERQPVYGWTFRQGRFDVGNKLDYLQATVELALEREDLGPPFRKFLMERLARDQGLEPQVGPAEGLA